jgi:hypothetical protein
MVGVVFFRVAGFVAAVWIAVAAGAGIHSDRRLLVAFVVGGVLVLPIAGMAWFLDVAEVWDSRAVALASSVAVGAGLLLAVPVCGALGLPYRVSGFWGLLLATAAVSLVGFQVSRVFVQLVLGDLDSWDVPMAGGYLLTVGGLWLTEAALPGVHFPGSLGEKLTTLAVLAAFFRLFGGNVVYFVRAYGLARIVPSVLAPLVVCGVKLWLLCWLSQALTTPLSVSGFWWFALATALLTAATAPVWLFEQWMRVEAEAEQYRAQWEAQQHQQAMANFALTSALSTARYVSDRARRGR